MGVAAGGHEGAGGEPPPTAMEALTTPVGMSFASGCVAKHGPAQAERAAAAGQGVEGDRREQAGAGGPRRLGPQSAAAEAHSAHVQV